MVTPSLMAFLLHSPVRGQHQVRPKMGKIPALQGLMVHPIILDGSKDITETR